MRLCTAFLSLFLVTSGSVGYAQALSLSGETGGTHDPSIIKEGSTYYVFATGAAFASSPDSHADGPPAPGAPPRPRPVSTGQIQIRCSQDMLAWKRCGQVFPHGVPEWIKTLSPTTKDLWAPDISYFNGVYHMYYTFSVFGKNTSGIALLTNVTLDPGSPKYEWIDRGLVLQSFASDDYNAIDANLVLDATGEPWMAFGSFWSGIKMRRLDKATGLLSKADTKTYALASRKRPAQEVAGGEGLPPNTQAVEAPFILRHEGFFYLFVSWDLCCRGAKSTYREMVGRSRSVTGPYLDRENTPLLAGGGTQLLYPTEAWVGPGGASVLHTTGVSGKSLQGEDFIVYHAYAADVGRPSLQISPIHWQDGWPAAETTASKP